jgi:hypothetical protein
MRWLLLGSLLLLTLAGMGQPRPVLAQESLWIAGSTLRLGMPKAEVISILQRADHDLIPGAGDAWAIVSRRANQLAGLVSFEQGKLNSVSKGWGNFTGPETVALANALKGVLAEATQTGSRSAVVRTQTQHEPTVTANSITIIFGKRSVSLAIVEGKGREPTVAVTETVSE